MYLFLCCTETTFKKRYKLEVDSVEENNKGKGEKASALIDLYCFKECRNFHEVRTCACDKGNLHSKKFFYLHSIEITSCSVSH